MQQPRSARDERYLNCTSFEVYMITGAIFIIGFTIAFILSVVYKMEVMVWPASVVVLLLCGGAFHFLRLRERAAKIREIDGS